MSPKSASKKSNPKASKPNVAVQGHEERVFQLGSKLLRALEDHRTARNDENVKGIGWFLVCVGESLEKGSLVRARTLRKANPNSSSIPSTPSLAVGFCVLGDQIMNWAAGIYHQEKS